MSELISLVDREYHGDNFPKLRKQLIELKSSHYSIAEVLAAYANLLLHHEKPRVAYKIINKALSIKPKQNYFFIRAKIILQLSTQFSHEAKYRDIFEVGYRDIKKLSQQDKNRDFYILLACYWYEQSKHDKAIMLIKKVLAKQKNSEYALVSAISFLRPLIRKSANIKPDDALIILDNGDRFDKNTIQEIKKYYNTLLNHYPKPKHYLQRAYFHYNISEAPAALADIKQALQRSTSVQHEYIEILQLKADIISQGKLALYKLMREATSKQTQSNHNDTPLLTLSPTQLELLTKVEEVKANLAQSILGKAFQPYPIIKPLKGTISADSNTKLLKSISLFSSLGFQPKYRKIEGEIETLILSDGQHYTSSSKVTAITPNTTNDQILPAFTVENTTEISLVSYFSNHQQIETNNSREINPLNDFSGLNINKVSAKNSIKKFYADHKNSVNDYIESNPSVEIIHDIGIETLQKHMKNKVSKSNQYRLKLGLITKSEFFTLFQSSNDLAYALLLSEINQHLKAKFL